MFKFASKFKSVLEFRVVGDVDLFIVLILEDVLLSFIIFIEFWGICSVLRTLLLSLF